MKKNMGTVDRVLRLIVAAALVFLYLTQAITGTTALILMLVAAVFALTSAMGFCPLYIPFGINTCAKKNRDQ